MEPMRMMQPPLTTERGTCVVLETIPIPKRQRIDRLHSRVEPRARIEQAETHPAHQLPRSPIDEGLVGEASTKVCERPLKLADHRVIEPLGLLAAVHVARRCRPRCRVVYNKSQMRPVSSHHALSIRRGIVLTIVINHLSAQSKYNHYPRGGSPSGSSSSLLAFTS
jgi:hypothetical protein